MIAPEASIVERVLLISAFVMVVLTEGGAGRRGRRGIDKSLI